MLMKLLKVYATEDKQTKRLAQLEQYNTQKAQRDSEISTYDIQNKLIENSIISAVRDGLGQYADGLTIKVDMYYGTGYQVRIDNGDNPHKEGQALSWSVNVHLDRNGNVQFDTSSWSGLDAMDERHIADLRRTVEILDIIQHMDWKSILDKVVPKWEDYVKTPEPEDPSK